MSTIVNVWYVGSWPPMYIVLPSGLSITSWARYLPSAPGCGIWSSSRPRYVGWARAVVSSAWIGSVVYKRVPSGENGGVGMLGGKVDVDMRCGCVQAVTSYMSTGDCTLSA